MGRDKFNKNDLRLVYWQPAITFHDTSWFSKGDKVFLKSNPEVPMTVEEVDEKHVWVRVDHNDQFFDVIPQAILHYEYAGLMVTKNDENVIISLN